MSKLVYDSTDASILVQIITGIVGIRGLYEKVKPEHEILKSILGWEMIVQVIELMFYIFIIRKMVVMNMASIRYFDWIITTPVMLITSAVYYKYEEYIEKLENVDSEDTRKELEKMSFTKFLKENKDNIGRIVFFNILMLLFGYLGERGIIDKQSGFIFGSISMIISFYIIYDQYARYSKRGSKLFSIMFILWAMYGIAYLLNPVYKNVMFNGLDILAKNFFGLYLYYKIKKVQR